MSTRKHETVEAEALMTESERLRRPPSLAEETTEDITACPA